MKILIVGVFRSISTSIWQANGFETLGHTVIRYDYRVMAKRLRYLKGRVRKIDIPKRDNHLITLCREEQPDIILFCKCNLMDVRVVKECNKIGTTVLWYMDDQGPNWDAELIDKMKHCNYVFCSVKKCAEDAKQYCKNTYRLQGGYNPLVHYPISLPKTRGVAFIGTIRPEKRIYTDAYDFDVITGMYNEAHSHIVSETKINLNFTHGGGTSNRLYKLLAAKGFVLTESWNGMEEDFEPGKDFVVFDSPGDLKEKILYYLVCEDERMQIAAHGYETVKRYDNINYARRILEAVS